MNFVFNPFAIQALGIMGMIFSWCKHACRIFVFPKKQKSNSEYQSIL